MALTLDILIHRELHMLNSLLQSAGTDIRTPSWQKRIRRIIYISLFVDVTGYSKYALPHFTTHTEHERGHGLYLHLVGVLIHAPVGQYRLITVSTNDNTGSKHVIEGVHQVINDIWKVETVPAALLFLV